MKIYGRHRDFAAADALVEKGQFEQAMEAFEALDNENVSAPRREEAREARDYAAARLLLQKGSYGEAVAAFETLGSYCDSADQKAAAQEALYA